VFAPGLRVGFAEQSDYVRRTGNKQMVYQNAQPMATFITETGTEFGNWCCGVTSNPQSACSKSHRVNKDTGLWIYRTPAPYIALSGSNSS